jgi:hypothetical protein
VALIVTTATLLADRSVVVVPGTSIHVRNGLYLGLFDLPWTTLTVLWFAQILWKHLGAMNPDRYLEIVSRPCQFGRETAVLSGQPRAPRRSSDLGMGW